MGVASTQPRTTAPVPLERAERHSRDLTAAQRRVQAWVKRNHGSFSRISRDLKLSVAFIHRVAYGRDASSAGLRVEQRLKALGCPVVPSK